jgi:hypothetical protein
MDNKTFKDLIKKGELSLILMDGGADLTPSQMRKVESTAGDLSDDRLEKMALELAASPGYQEMMMNPLMSVLLPKIFNVVDDKNKTAEPEKKETPAPESPKAELDSSQDPNLTTTSPNDTSEISPGDSITEAATKLYNFVVKNYEYDNKQAKKDKEYRDLLVNKKEKRVKQLIGLFKVDKVKQSKVETEVKKKETESKSTNEVGKNTGNKTTSKVTEPSAPTTPSASKVPSAGGTVGTIVKGVVGAGLAAVGASAIGGAESGGNYNITYGDQLDKKKNIVRGSNMSPEQKFGKDLTELTLEEVDMLGKERNRAKMNTSAMGKYQFMNSTLFGYKDKSGVFRPGLVQRLNLDMKTTKFSPEVQEKLYAVFRQDNLNTLQKLGVPITPGYEYMAHYLGAGGAKAIYDRRNTDMTVQKALVDAGLKDPVNGKVNEELTRLKAADFEFILESRLKKHGLEPHAEAKPTPAVSESEPTKPQIPSQMKKSSSSRSNNVAVENNTMNVVQPSTTYQITQQNQSNQSQLIEKQYNGN